MISERWYMPIHTNQVAGRWAGPALPSFAPRSRAFLCSPRVPLWPSPSHRTCSSVVLCRQIVPPPVPSRPAPSMPNPPYSRALLCPQSVVFPHRTCASVCTVVSRRCASNALPLCHALGSRTVLCPQFVWIPNSFYQLSGLLRSPCTPQQPRRRPLNDSLAL